MNFWTQLSVEFASQKNYLDELFKVYPISPNLKRDLPESKWSAIQAAFNERNNEELIKALLDLDLFPIKDSYVSYLKNDPSAMLRNPQTINRIAGNLYSMGLNEIYEKCIEPKESNRQMGPMFKHWIDKGTLGAPIYRSADEFFSTDENGILNTSDETMKIIATDMLGYSRDKGLDFFARFNGIYVLGEAKFLTDFGGHQNGQFADAVSTLKSEFISGTLNAKVVPIAIMDGVLYIEKNSKMHNYLKTHDDQLIISSLLLREFLYSL